MMNLFQPKKESQIFCHNVFHVLNIFLIVILLVPSIAWGQKQKEIELIVECVEYIGNDTFVANFGYNNPNKTSVIVPEGDSYVVYNKGQAKKNAISTFEIGRQYNVFKEIFRHDDYCEWTVTLPNGKVKTTRSDINSAHCLLENNDIIPYYDPPQGGKLSYSLIGPELTSLNKKYSLPNANPSDFESDDIFQIRLGQDGVNKDVLIEVISVDGQYGSFNSGPPQTGTLMVGDLITLGMYVVKNDPLQNTVAGWFPIDKLTEIDLLPDKVIFARPVFPTLSNDFPDVGHEGDIALKSSNARQVFTVLQPDGITRVGIDGTGIKVGVLSDSYNSIGTAEQDIDTKDLPQDGVDLGGDGNPWEYQYGIASDEGRAMLQIIHEVAPGAQLAFRTAYNNLLDFAQGIYDLADEDCDIIVDDVTYITEPFFGGGPVNEAIDAVTADGVSYFTSAGNSGKFSYEADFTYPTSGNQRSVHLFGGNDYLQKIFLDQGNYTIVLQWVDDFASLGQGTGAKIDLDFYLADDEGNIQYGFNTDSRTKDPVEVMPFTVVSPTAVTNIMIKNAFGFENVHFKYVVFRAGDSDSFIFNEYEQGTSTIVGHANNINAMTVGAWGLRESTGQNEMRPYSSTGVGSKPDFTAYDGSTITFNLASGSEVAGKFFGTSAAAPHAAGVAALLRDAISRYNISGAESIRSLLQTTALDIGGDGGFDNISGWGLIQADAALAKLANPTPIIYEPPQSLNYDAGINPGFQLFDVTVTGEYLTDQTEVYLNGEILDGSGGSGPAYDSESGNLIVQVPLFGNINPAFTAFTPSKEGATGDGGFSNPIRFEGNDVTIFVRADQYHKSDDQNNKIFNKYFGEEIPDFIPKLLVEEIPGASNPTYIDAVFPAGMEDFVNELNSFIEFQVIPFETGQDIDRYLDVDLYAIQAGWKYSDDSEDPDYNLNFANFITELEDLGITGIEFQDGNMQILPLPITVTANDIGTEEAPYYFGDPMIFSYSYSWPSEMNGTPININDEDGVFTNNIAEIHRVTNDGINELDDYFILSNGRPYMNGKPFMNIMVTPNVLNNGKPYLNAGGVDQNGNQVFIDIDDLIDNYLNPPDDGSDYVVPFSNYDDDDPGNGSRVMVNADVLFDGRPYLNAVDGSTISLNGRPYMNGKPFLNGRPYMNGKPYLNGKPFMNAVVSDGTGEWEIEINGRPYMNGRPYLNADGTSRISDVYVIIDKEDFLNPPGYGDWDDVIPLLPITLITGTGVTPHENILIDGEDPQDNTTEGEGWIYPAALINSNFEVTYVKGTLTIDPAPVTVNFTDLTGVYDGTAKEPTVSVTLDKDGSGLVGLVAFTYKLNGEPVDPENVINAGNYEVMVSLTDPNYSIHEIQIAGISTGETPEFTIDPASLTITPLDGQFKIYGEDDPLLGYTFQAGDLIEGIWYYEGDGFVDGTALSRETPETQEVGFYDINLGTLFAGPNYNIILSAEIKQFEIIPAELIIIADDQGKNYGETPDPALTYDITKDGVIVDIPTLSGSLVRAAGEDPGEYQITENGSNPFSAPNYQIVDIVPGSFYINPYGPGTKKIRTYLDCVEEDFELTSGYPYIANFRWENTNSFDFFIPQGDDNFITGNPGSFVDVVPEVFYQGTGTFSVPFDGTRLIWTLASYESNLKTSVSWEANSSSNKCHKIDNGARIADTNMGSADAESIEDELTFQNSSILMYPNPVKDKFIIRFDGEQEKVQDIFLFDSQGKYYTIRTHWIASENGYEVDLSQMNHGLYLIKLELENRQEILRVVKE